MSEHRHPPIPPVRKSIHVRWAPEDAFRRFTRDIGTWWPMHTHSIGQEKTESVVFEERVGGRLYERIAGGGESTWGTVLHWEPPHRVVFTWHPGQSPELAQEVELRFTAEKTGSRLELTHSKWERMGAAAKKARRAYALGWSHVIRLGAGRKASPIVWGMEALIWVGGIMKKIFRTAAVTLLALVVASPALADRVLRTELKLDAPIERVWHAWTTDEGIRTFFAPGSHIELRVDGPYEIFFAPKEAPGHRGADDMRLLVVEPMKRLAFTWNAPGTQPYVRAQRTVVTLDFQSVDAKTTKLRFTHSGWGEGPEWDKAYAYFDSAWNTFVLPSLQYTLAHGPIDWTKPRELKPVAKTLKTELE